MKMCEALREICYTVALAEIRRLGIGMTTGQRAIFEIACERRMNDAVRAGECLPFRFEDLAKMAGRKQL